MGAIKPLQVKICQSLRRKWNEAKYLCVMIWSVGSIYFLFFILNGKKKPPKAKKMLMDKMLSTYGMENCTQLSQKAASEECTVAATSQVPDLLHH